jgi:hypothetical protein
LAAERLLASPGRPELNALGRYALARRRDPPQTTGGPARFTTSRIAKLDWIRATRGNRDSSQ